VQQACPVYNGDSAAIYGLDPTGGGKNIPVGTTYASPRALFYQTTPLVTLAFEIYERIALGQTVVTGTTAFTSTENAFVTGDQFTMAATEPGTATSVSATVTLGGQTVSAFLAAVSAAGIANVSASVNTAGNIVFTHATGGSISQ
jgi:hypothetical protein